MLSPEEIQRYNRHIILPEIGVEGQEKLKNASVLVVGAGGLGSPVLLYLAAAGIGRIGVIDNDTVSISNLQRQILYDSDEIGEPKVGTAIVKLSKLNPHTVFESYETMLNVENAIDIIKEYDVIVECTDNFRTRFLVNDCCVLLHKPFVFASVLNYEGQVSVFNYKGGPTYRCLYPEPPVKNNIPTEEKIGLLGVLPGITGTLQANEVLKIITGIGNALSGKLLVFDILNNNFITLNIEPVQKNKEIRELNDPIYL